MLTHTVPKHAETRADLLRAVAVAELHASDTGVDEPHVGHVQVHERVPGLDSALAEVDGALTRRRCRCRRNVAVEELAHGRRRHLCRRRAGVVHRPVAALDWPIERGTARGVATTTTAAAAALPATAANRRRRSRASPSAERVPRCPGRGRRRVDCLPSELSRSDRFIGSPPRRLEAARRIGHRPARGALPSAAETWLFTVPTEQPKSSAVSASEQVLVVPQHQRRALPWRQAAHLLPQHVLGGEPFGRVGVPRLGNMSTGRSWKERRRRHEMAVVTIGATHIRLGLRRVA